MGRRHSYIIEYSEDAVHDLRHFDRTIAFRIQKKIRYFASQENPLRYCEPVIGFQNLYKWRVGKWRIFFEKKPKSNELTLLWILQVEKRDKAYKNLQ